MEIVEDRYEAGSILITSQLPLNGTWHEIIGEPTFADAILDRLVHNAYRLELDGQSFRKKDPQLRDETPELISKTKASQRVKDGYPGTNSADRCQRRCKNQPGGGAKVGHC